MTRKTATRPLVLTEKVMVTLSSDQRARIEEIAKAEDRSMTSICRRMVVDALERMETDKATHQKGVRP